MIDRLCELANKEKIPLLCLCEYRDGKTVTRRIARAGRFQNVYSVSKNVTATAIGMLCDQGLLSLDNNLYDLFHPLCPACREEYRAVTVSHLLTQTIGIESGFLDIDVEQLNSRDFLTLCLSEKPFYPPGVRFVYSDSNYYLASRIVSVVSGQRLQDYLTTRLFEPLGVQGWAWANCPQGYAMGATGLFLDVEGMAAFGRLYLQKGQWDGKQIVSESWVERATAGLVSAGPDRIYGYSFWRIGQAGAYYCSGMYGQMIFIDPARARVVAWQAHDIEGKTDLLLKVLQDC